MEGAEERENLGEDEEVGEKCSGEESTENRDCCCILVLVVQVQVQVHWQVPRDSSSHARSLPHRSPAAHLQLSPPRPHSRRRTQRLRHLESPLQATQNRSHPSSPSLPISSLSALTFLQGFFSSLFTAGFLESSNSPGLQHVDIVFDDRNITRPGASPHLPHHLTHHPSAAFEYVRPLPSSLAAHPL